MQVKYKHKTVQSTSSIPFLTKNLIYTGDKIMAELRRTKEKRICQVEGCERSYRAQGYCNKHYMQMRRDGKIGALEKQIKLCKVDGCEEKVRRNGYCERHSKQMERLGKIIETYMDMPPKICDVDGCNEPHHGNGYCSRHYQQIGAHGRLLDRTRLDPNEVRFDGNDCYISLYDTFANFVAETVIDKEDYKKVKDYKWRISNYGYVVCNIDSSKKQLFLHHLVVGKPENDHDTDHIDRNKLNNRVSNLRFVTRAQNMWNTTIRNNNKSGFKGVFWNKITSKWQANITAKGKNKYLGAFDNPIDAAEAYDKACEELHGEFGCTNKEALANAS